LAVAGSHDLPTLIAWMRASDLALKDELKLFPSAELKEEAQQRRHSDRQQLLAAFKELELLSDPSLQLDRFADAAHVFLASSSSAITMVQIDDITQETTPVNVPATSTEHPNWRRRLSMSLEEIAGDSRFHALTRVLNEARAGNVSNARRNPAVSVGANGSRPVRASRGWTDTTQTWNARMNTSNKAIAELAFELWEARGRPHGTAEEDWLEAERRLAASGQTEKPSALPNEDEASIESFPASDPPASRTPDVAASNAGEKWAASKSRRPGGDRE